MLSSTDAKAVSRMWQISDAKRAKFTGKDPFILQRKDLSAIK